MKKKQTKKLPWKTTDNRFVAFIDILGFKDKVMRDSHEEIYSQLSKISRTKQYIEEVSNNPIFMRKFGDSDTFIVNFSDSIIVFSKNDSIGNFNFFLEVITYLFSNAINNKIPLKGGISHGKISVNKTEQIYFGQPIIDAYSIEEDVNYLGIVAHNSIDKYISLNIKQLNPSELSVMLFEEKTPLKSGQIEHLNINWFRGLYTTPNKEERINYIKSTLKDFKSTVSGSPRRYIDNTVDIFEKTQIKQIKK